jgi:PAS domain S-box-containing protein
VPRRTRWLGFSLSVASLALLATLDLVSGPGSSLTATFAIAPVICALLGGPRQTVVVAVLAGLCALFSGWQGGVLMQPDYAVRLAIVALAGTISALGALTKARLEGYADRMQLLAGIGEVVDGSLPLDETIDRVLRTLVPTLADIAILDTAGDDGVVVRKAVRALPGQEDLAQALADSPPTGPRAPGATRALLTGRPVLMERLSDRILSAAAHDAEDLELMRSINANSSIILPVRARGQILGALTLFTTGTRAGYTQTDLDFAVVLVGRIGLGLDNAGLTSRLAGTEQRMSAIMGNLAEAVTVQDPDGTLIYANQAAADMLGFGTVDAVISAGPGEIAAQFEMFHEDGTPVAPEELPGRRVLAGEQPDPLLVRSVDRRSGQSSWQLVKAKAVPDPAGRPILAVNVFEDVTDARRGELHQRFLAEAGDILASSIEQGTTLQEVAGLAVPEIADWCSVHMAGTGDEAELVAIAHMDPSRVAFAQELHQRYPVRLDDERGLGLVLRTGESQLTHIDDDAVLDAVARDAEHARMLRQMEIRSVMHVPMKVADTVIGAMAFVNSGDSRRFDERDLGLAEEIGRRAAAAMENARLHAERTSVSQALQAGLMPPALPEMEGWAARSLYRAAGEQTDVGGDFYDAFRVADGWMLVVGDVAGRGAPAAALTTLARYTIRTAGQLGSGPSEAFEFLNRALRERGDLSLCAAVLVHLGDAGGRATARLVCAGSPPPLLLRNGGSEEVGNLGPFLGAFDEAGWEMAEVELAERDLLVIYTDGILDAQGETDRFGEERLRSMLKGSADPRDVIARVERALDSFVVGNPRDDTALVAVMRTAVAAAAGRRPRRSVRARA